jgi:hypothetical protein
MNASENIMFEKNLLADFGFVFKEIKFEKAKSMGGWMVSPERTSYIFENITNKFKIWLNYSPKIQKKPDPRIRNNYENFGVMIINDKGDVCIVSSYLEKYGRWDAREKFFNKHGLSFEVFRREFIEALVGLLSKELKPMLDGSQWETTPIDWQNYK